MAVAQFISFVFMMVLTESLYKSCIYTLFQDVECLHKQESLLKK